MKVRGREELLDALSNSSAFRKRELVWFRQRLPPHSRSPEELLCRLAPVSAYSHWEGFVKEAGVLYAAYVGRKAIPLSSMTPNFQAMVCRPAMLCAATATKRIQPHLDVIDLLIDRCNESTCVSGDNSIDTESNLSWQVFENICLTLGLDTQRWIAYKAAIGDLVRDRCQVAHGERLKIEPKVAVDHVEFVLMALDLFKTDIENAALTQAYLRAPKT